MRTRLFTACLIGLLSAVLCYWYQVSFQRGAGDISWPLCAGRALLTNTDPYDCSHLMSSGLPGPTNPLTTAIITLPLLVFPAEFAAAIFFGLSSTLLAFALLRTDEMWRLLVFLAFPYWAALQTVQWSPLLFAIALYPTLLPITLAKPHIGLPIALTNLTKTRLLACILFGFATLLLYPSWPWRWINQIGTYDGFIPILTIPGPLLLLVLFRWREKQARFLLLLAAVPQRLFYDQFLLWLLPESKRQVLLLVCLSWIGYFGAYFTGQLAQEWIVTMVYIPILVIILTRQTLKKRHAHVSTFSHQ